MEMLNPKKWPLLAKTWATVDQIMSMGES